MFSFCFVRAFFLSDLLFLSVGFSISRDLSGAVVLWLDTNNQLIVWRGVALVDDLSRKPA
jgi:hypothetical protein